VCGEDGKHYTCADVCGEDGKHYTCADVCGDVIYTHQFLFIIDLAAI